MLRNLVFNLIALFFFLVPLADAAEATAAQPFYFLALTDIHFDPFAACYHVKSRKTCPVINQLRSAPASEWQSILAAQDTTQPTFNRDTGFVLLRNSLQEAALAAREQHTDFVLVLGDTLVHEFRVKYKRYTHDNTQAGYRRFVLKTLEFVNVMLRQAFPKQDILMLTGNNDTYSKNYYLEPDGAFFHDAGHLWSSLLQAPEQRQQMQEQFAVAGYYALDLPGHPQIRLIALNTVLFSKKSRDEKVQIAAQLELDWLHQQLQRAKDKHQRVLLTLHIPPTLNVSVMQRINLFDAHEFFRGDDLQRFQQELTDYYPQIAGVISGHLHYDWQQLFSVGNNHRVLIVTVPSISPVFGNDPAFKVFRFGSRLESVDTYTYPLLMSPSWTKKTRPLY